MKIFPTLTSHLFSTLSFSPSQGLAFPPRTFFAHKPEVTVPHFPLTLHDWPQTKSAPFPPRALRWPMQHSRCHSNFSAASSSFLLTRHRFSMTHRTIKSFLIMIRCFPALKQDVFVYLQILYDLTASAWLPSHPPNLSFVLIPCWCTFLTHTWCICVFGTLHTLFLLLHTFLPQYVGHSIHCLSSDSVKAPSQRSLAVTTTTPPIMHCSISRCPASFPSPALVTVKHSTFKNLCSDLICVLLKSKGHESPRMKLSSVSFLGPNRAWCAIVV